MGGGCWRRADGWPAAWPATWWAVAMAIGLVGLDATAMCDAAAIEPRPTVAHEASVRDDWFILRLGDAPVGWMQRRRDVIDLDGTALVRSVRRTCIRLARGDATIELDTTSSLCETTGGVPRVAEVRSRSGGADTSVHWTFAAAGISERRVEDGREFHRDHPLPEAEWLTPTAVDLFIAGRLEAGAERISWCTLDPEAGPLLTRITMEAIGPAETRVGDRVVSGSRWSVESSAAPGLRTMQVWSSDGHLLRETTETAFGRLTAERSDRATATASVDAAPVEVMARSYVVPAGRLDSGWDRVRYLVRHEVQPGAAAAPPIVGGPMQRVRAAEDGWWWVETGVRPRAGTTDDAGQAAAPPADADRVASRLIDADDPEVQRLAERVARTVPTTDPPSALALGEAMRLAVWRHIAHKDLDRLFDSASRTARSRRGDCSEHAVLLAAMLRARKVPARIAVGLVHLERPGPEPAVFGWHMWTRAWIDGRWVDLDATRRDGFGPTHIRLGETAGGGSGMLTELTAVLGQVGRLEIRIVDGTPS